jgi:hypothetical protein
VISPAAGALDLLRLVAGQAGVEEGRVHAGFEQRAHLVVHQRDQRRDHHGHAVAGALAHDGRHLVTQRLAAAGGHEHQGVAAGAQTWVTMPACGPRKAS